MEELESQKQEVDNTIMSAGGFDENVGGFMPLVIFGLFL